jgi:hypothetical protein
MSIGGISAVSGAALPAPAASSATGDPAEPAPATAAQATGTVAPAPTEPLSSSVLAVLIGQDVRLFGSASWP